MTSPDPNILPFPKAIKPLWEKCRYGNMRRYSPTGIIYANAKVKGHPISKSLETKSETIAKMKLDKLLDRERKRPGNRSVEMTFKALAEQFTERLLANPDAKATTRLYRADTLKAIRAVWPELDELTVGKITQEAIAKAAGRLRPKYAPTRYNGTLETLRAVLQLGVELGAIAENPMVFANKRKGIQGIPRAKVLLKDWKLPERAKFDALVERLNALPSRLRASRTVRFIAFSGLRIGAARLVMPSDVDLERNCLSKPAFKYTDRPTRLPMFKELRKVVEELKSDYPGTGPLLPIKNPRRALKKACEECGIEPLTNHALRKLFATRCLESGVDVKTVASWMDHKDGGALLLRVYAHLTDKHSDSMSKRVKF